MDQAILMIRNPRRAMPSYMTMRHELGFSGSWESSFGRKDFVYTERPNVTTWEVWRDTLFEREMDLWGWFIEFWMEGGMRRNDGNGQPYQEENCQTLLDCFPKAVISYENIMDETNGADEMAKLAAVLEGHEADGLTLIDSIAYGCMYDEVLNQREKHNNSEFKLNKHREGISSSEFHFTLPQLRAMEIELQRLYQKYNLETRATAVDLSTNLQAYIEEVQTEISLIEAGIE